MCIKEDIIILYFKYLIFLIEMVFILFYLYSFLKVGFERIDVYIKLEIICI